MIFISTSYNLIVAILSIGVIGAIIFYVVRYKNKSKTIHYNTPDRSQLFSEFTENIHQVLWRMSITTNEFTYISPNAEKIFGMSVELINKNPDSWLVFVQPEDRLLTAM